MLRGEDSIDNNSDTANANGAPPPLSYLSATSAIKSPHSDADRRSKTSSPSPNNIQNVPLPVVPTIIPFDLLQRNPDNSKIYETIPNSIRSNSAIPISIQVSNHDHQTNIIPSTLLNLSISGTKFSIPRKSLLRHPTTFLGALISNANLEVAQTQCDVYIPETNEYYFERSPQIFGQILSFYRHGTYHVPNDVCPDEFLTEILYWGLQPEFVADCCKDRIPSFLWKYHETSQTHKNDTHCSVRKRVRDPFANVRFGATRKRLWRILANPWKSWGSKIFSCVAISFILLTMVSITVHSCIQYQIPHRPRHDTSSTSNGTVSNLYTKDFSIPLTEGGDENGLGFGNLDYKSAFSSDQGSNVVIVSYFLCVAWLTLEFTMRLFASPKRVKFLKMKLSILDLICITFSYIGLFVYFGAGYGSVARRCFLVVHFFQVLQMFRITRYSAEIRFMFFAVYQAAHQIFLFFVVVGILITFFGVLLYTVEVWNQKTEITTIPLAIYWAFITVTTVGYGDITPHSAAGRVIAMIATFTGVIILGFPISLVVSQFSDTYETECDRKRRKREIMEIVQSRDASMKSKPSSVRKPATKSSKSLFQSGRSGCSQRKSHYAGALGRQMFIVRRHGENSDGGGVGAIGGMSLDAIQKLAIARMFDAIPKDALDGILNEAFSEDDIDSDSSIELEEEDEPIKAKKERKGKNTGSISSDMEKY